MKKILFLFLIVLETLSINYKLHASETLSDADRDQLIATITRSFETHIPSQGHKLNIESIDFNRDNAADTYALFKVGFETQTNQYFVKFHSESAQNSILNDLQEVKTFFLNKNLTKVSIVHSCWSEPAEQINNTITTQPFSVFPFINGDTVYKLVMNHFENQDQGHVNQHFFEELGEAIAEFHRTGVVDSQQSIDNILTHCVHGDLHAENIFYNDQGFSIIDNQGFVRAIKKPRQIINDLHTAFMQLTFSLYIFHPEFGDQVNEWQLAFCKGYINIFDEYRKQQVADHLSSILTQCLQNVCDESYNRQDLDMIPSNYISIIQELGQKIRILN